MKENSRGLVSLEYAMAAAMILPLILMMTDTANLYRARGTIAQSLNSTLRCLAAVNGDCINYQAPEYKAQYVADLYTSTTGWPVQYQRYGYETEWLETDLTRYFDPTVRILDTMTHREQQKELLLVENNSTADFKVEHPVMLYDSPYVDTGENRDTARVSKFYLTEGRKQKYPRTSIDLSSVVLHPTEKGRTASLKFKAPMPEGLKEEDLARLNKDCFKAEKFGRAKPDYALKKSYKIYEESCSSDVALEYVIQFNGNLINNGLQSTGSSKSTVKIFLNHEEDTGGFVAARRINPELVENANFVPRGNNLSKPYLSATHDYAELNEFYKDDKILLVPGKTYRLNFQLIDLEGTGLGWRGTKAKVMAPVFTTFKKGGLLCKNDRYKYNKKAEIVGCKSPVYLIDSQAGPPVPNYLLHRDTQRPDLHTSSLGCKFLAEPEPKHTGECARRGHCSFDSTFNSLVCSDTKVSTTQCDAENFGSTSDQYKTIYAACLGEAAAQDADSKNFSFTKKTMHLSDTEFLHQAKDCFNESINYPAPLSNYKEVLHIKSEISGIPAKVATANLPTAEFLKLNPQYNCPANFRPEKESVPPGQAEVGLFRDTILAGVHPVDCSYADQVKATLRDKLSLPAGQFIGPTSENVSGLITYLKTKPAVGACYHYLQPVVTADLSSAPIESFTYTADNYPARCNLAGHSCQVRSAGFTKLGEEERVVDIAAAKQRAESALRASYPLSHPCKNSGLPKDDYCFDLGVEFDGNKFDVTLDLNLPVLSLFNQKQVRLTRTESHYWQGAY